MPNLLRRLARFAVVGLIATLTHAAVFTTAIEAFQVEPVAANALAFCAAVLVGYTLNRHWTFAAHGGQHGRLWRYVVGALAGLAANSVIMYVVVHVAHASPYLGLVLGIVTVPPLTFAINQRWVFRRRA